MVRVVFVLQGCLQLALPSTQLIAAAWLGACLAHTGPWHGALPVGEGNGTAGMRVQLCILRSRPSGPSPLPAPLPLGVGVGGGEYSSPGLTALPQGRQPVRRSGWGVRMRRRGQRNRLGPRGAQGGQGAGMPQRRARAGERAGTWGACRLGRGRRGRGPVLWPGWSSCGYITFPRLLSQESGQGAGGRERWANQSEPARQLQGRGPSKLGCCPAPSTLTTLGNLCKSTPLVLQSPPPHSSPTLSPDLPCLPSPSLSLLAPPQHRLAKGRHQGLALHSPTPPAPLLGNSNPVLPSLSLPLHPPFPQPSGT